MKTGTYTLDKPPVRSGAQFSVTMDDGPCVSPPIRLRTLTRRSDPHLPTGRSTGGVSLIQTVGSPSDASCLIADVSSMSTFFTLNPTNPTIPSQFSLQTVSFYTIPFIPGGQPFTLDRPTSNSTTQTVWDVHIREGTQKKFLVQPAASD